MILDNIVRQAESMLGADAVTILQAQGKDGGGAFVRLDVGDPYSNITAADLDEVEASIDRVLQQRQPLTAYGAERSAPTDGRYHTHLVVPMVVGSEVIGIVVYFFMAHREFTGDQIDTAVVLSEQAFVAVAQQPAARTRPGGCGAERARAVGRRTA
ncbi:MAG: GAF domain-containing protein [Tetrasphaera sp.]